MKILLAGHFIGHGGIQSHLLWLTKALQEAGVEVLALSVSESITKSEDWQYLQKFDIGKVDFICASSLKEKKFVPSSFVNLAKITAIINKFSPDIYLAIGTGWNLFIPPLLAGTPRRRIFYEVMSGVADSWRNSRWGVRWWFNEVIGQSPTVAETFALSFGWKKQITAIPAIPEPLEITATLPNPILKPIKLGTAKAALFSRLVPHKQAFWLVQQWDLLKDVLGELHIHGSGPEEPLIREYIASHGLGDRIKCFGRYPKGQAYVDLLSSYDMTLLPTVGAEGAPLVLLESMACGVPFVAYGVGGIPDYGVDNPNVLVVAPEPWITDQAKTYANVKDFQKPVIEFLKDIEAQSINQFNLKTFAFVSGVKQMAYKLAQSEINQVQLQQFYLKHYSYSVLKQAWISYLCPK